jgi:transposase-like protein
MSVKCNQCDHPMSFNGLSETRTHVKASRKVSYKCRHCDQYALEIMETMRGRVVYDEILYGVVE